MHEVLLKADREKSIKKHHPWLFSGAIKTVFGNPGLGETVKVLSSNGEELGFGAYSPNSSIRIRMWNFDPNQEIDEIFFTNKIRSAIKYRSYLKLELKNQSAYRLLYGESDGLPGFIVDKYDDFLVIQSLSAGSEMWKNIFVKKLVEITGIKNIFERSDVTVRKLEGLEEKKGSLSGDEPKDFIEITENNKLFLVDIRNGQKTGFYLDQQENRNVVMKYAANREVLNCFSYSGGFTIAALKGGANHVTSIESSQNALEIERNNILLNGYSDKNVTQILGDVFREMRTMRDMGSKFDMVILDPPKFAPTHAQVASASRGYKDINLLAFKLLNPGGILITFSCSGGIGFDLFRKIVAGAAIDAKVDANIIAMLHQNADHPVALNFPEGFYLKGLICRAMEK